MKIIYSDKILDRLSILMNIGGITLYPYIILRERHNVQPQGKSTLKLINHESIHIEQQKELLVIGFYIWYVLEWFIRLFMKGDAYKNISFEREAYENASNLEYINSRKGYSWFKYLKRSKK